METRVEKNTSWAVLPVLTFAQFSISSDTTTTALAASKVVAHFGGTTLDLQLINMVFGLVAGALMMAGGFVGMTAGWKRALTAGAFVAFAGELSMVLAPTVDVFTWIGRGLVGIGASLLIPAVLGFVPALFQGTRRAYAFGCITAGTGAAALCCQFPWDLCSMRLASGRFLRHRQPFLLLS